METQSRTIRTTIRSALSTFMSSYVHTDSGFLTHGYLEMIRSSGKRVFHGKTSVSCLLVKEENRSISSRSACSNLKIARDLTFSSDHLPLTITYSNHNRKSQLSLDRVRKTRLPLIRNWQPDDNWYNAIRLSTLSWQDWEAIPRLHELAREHARPRVNKQIDAELESLINARKNTDDMEMKQKLGRTIWRARRKAKRQRTQRDLEDACRNKRCPQLARRSMHFNWSKTFGPNGDASKQLFDYYSGVYEMAPEQRETQETTKAKCCSLSTVIKKLKPGKGSSDGVTAESLRELDESNLEAMGSSHEPPFPAQRASTILE